MRERGRQTQIRSRRASCSEICPSSVLSLRSVWETLRSIETFAVRSTRERERERERDRGV